MKKITVLSILILMSVVLVVGCGKKASKTGSKAASTAVSKSKVSKQSASDKTTSSATDNTKPSSTTEASASSDESTPDKTQESKWSQEASEAAKGMTVAQGREALRQANIDDSDFSNADINKYILAAHKAGQDLGTYMKSQGF